MNATTTHTVAVNIVSTQGAIVDSFEVEVYSTGAVIPGAPVPSAIREEVEERFFRKHCQMMDDAAVVWG